MSRIDVRLGLLLALSTVLLALASVVVPTTPASADPVEARPEPADALTVMSFNIASHHGCNQAAGCLYVDVDYMLDVVAELIVENGVDVVGLQEVDVDTARHNGSDMLEDLQDKLTALGYPMFGWFEARTIPPAGVEPGEFGIALLSRVPAESYSSQLFSPNGVASSAPVQQAVFDFDGTEVRVLNHHAYVQNSCDTITPGMIDPVVGTATIPDKLDEFTLLIGDFNDPLTSPCMSALQNTHQSVCIESGDPTCAIGVDQVLHPNHAWTVDHVMYRFGVVANVALLDGWVDQTVNEDATTHPGPNWVSDHYPIFGRFALDAAPIGVGDVNCDAQVNLVDALMISQYVAGSMEGIDGCPIATTPNAMYLSVADVDGDEAVDAADAQALLECLITQCTPVP